MNYKDHPVWGDCWKQLPPKMQETISRIKPTEPTPEIVRFAKEVQQRVKAWWRK